MNLKAGAGISGLYKLPFPISKPPMYTDNTTIKRMACLRRHSILNLGYFTLWNTPKVNVVAMAPFCYISHCFDFSH